MILRCFFHGEEFAIQWEVLNCELLFYELSHLIEKSISEQGGDILRYPKLRVHGVNGLDAL